MSTRIRFHFFNIHVEGDVRLCTSKMLYNSGETRLHFLSTSKMGSKVGTWMLQPFKKAHIKKFPLIRVNNVQV